MYSMANGRGQMVVELQYMQGNFPVVCAHHVEPLAGFAQRIAAGEGVEPHPKGDNLRLIAQSDSMKSVRTT